MRPDQYIAYLNQLLDTGRVPYWSVSVSIGIFLNIRGGFITKLAAVKILKDQWIKVERCIWEFNNKVDTETFIDDSFYLFNLSASTGHKLNIYIPDINKITLQEELAYRGLMHIENEIAWQRQFFTSEEVCKKICDNVN